MGTEHGPIITLATFTALRRSELLALEWADVDLDRGSIAVTKSLHRLADGREIVEPPKSKTSWRIVPLPRPAVTMLREHKDRQTKERQMLGTPMSDNTRVFERPDGTMLRPDSLTQIVLKLAKRLGFEGMNLHGIRHSVATVLEPYVGPAIVQRMLGHSSVQLTLDRYTHPGMERLREASDQLGKLLTNDDGGSAEEFAA